MLYLGIDQRSNQQRGEHRLLTIRAARGIRVDSVNCFSDVAAKQETDESEPRRMKV